MNKKTQKQNTLKRINDAIAKLKSDNYPLTITNICYISGLSRTTMYKEHVQSLLVENGVSVIPRNKSLGLPQNIKTKGGLK